MVNITLLETSFLYFDYNSTTPVDQRVIEHMQPYFAQYFGNASSSSHFSDFTRSAMLSANDIIGKLIGADGNEVHFTSGATESINLALKGLALHPANTKKHIITCSTEHKAVLQTSRHLESLGFEVDYLPVEPNGSIDLELLKSTVKSNTLLICLMWVNNETGVIHPIKEVGKIANEYGVYFVCDGTQGVGKIQIDVLENNIDILCFSGHKIYAPKGIGGIYINSSITKKNKIVPLIHGGGQESGLRSGTYNVPLITGLGKAFEIAALEMEENRAQINKLQSFLEKEILKIKGAYINGKTSDRIYTTVNFGISGFDTEVFMGINKDIAVSNGSACSSSLIQPSHVLSAMGLTNDNAMNTLRISLGKHNTNEETHLLIQRIKNFIES